MKKYKQCIALLSAVFLLLSRPVCADPAGHTAAGDGNPDAGVQSVYTQLAIDSENLYEGMEHTYSEGYVPAVRNGTVYLVVPIQCSGNLKDFCLKASLDLGESENNPFVYKNYEKSVYLQQHAVNGGATTANAYVAAFFMELKPDRVNGSYPVTVDIRTADEAGNEVGQTFTVYVTITDGTDPKAAQSTADPAQPAVFSPKVVISGCQFSKDAIQAGDEVYAKITLTNTSNTETVRDLTVAVSAPPEYFTLLEQSDTIYVPSIPANGSTDVQLRYRIQASAPQGQYELELTMNYADTNANVCSEKGKVMVWVNQPLKVQADKLSFPEKVEVADVVEASLQVMNFGRSRVYHVRAVMEADGLFASGTLYIGDLEPGMMGTGAVQVSVGSLSKEDSPYGKTDGVLTIYYEDENGQEFSEELSFQTAIQSPFSEETPKKEDRAGQWWVIMGVLAGVLVLFAAGMFIQKKTRRRGQPA